MFVRILAGGEEVYVLAHCAVGKEEHPFIL